MTGLEFRGGASALTNRGKAGEQEAQSKSRLQGGASIGGAEGLGNSGRRLQKGLLG